MTRAKTQLQIVDSEAEAAIADAAKQVAPMVQRLGSHRDIIDLAVKELESERFELISRRDLLRRQAQTVDDALGMHLDDIEATLALYERGTNSVNQAGE